MPFDDQNYDPEPQRPHGWWIVPAVIAGCLLLLACLISLYSMGAYVPLQRELQSLGG